MSPTSQPTWADHLEREGLGRLPPAITLSDVEHWPVEVRSEPTGALWWISRAGSRPGPPAEELWTLAWCAELAHGLLPVLDNLTGARGDRGTLVSLQRGEDVQALAAVIERCAARPVLLGAALTLLRVAGATELALLLYRDGGSARVQRLLGAALERHGVEVPE